MKTKTLKELFSINTRTTWMLFLSFAFLVLSNVQLNAQIAYTQDFTSCSAVTCSGWNMASGFSPNITATAANGYTPCSGASAKSNIYSSSTTTTLSSNTSLGLSNGSLATLDFDFKALDYSLGTATAAGSVNVDVQYATATAGPWTSMGSFTNASSATCLLQTFTFTPTSGSPVFVRMVSTVIGTIPDTWVVFDNIALNQAAPPCSGTPAPGNTVSSASSACSGSSVSLSLQNPTVGAGVTYLWESADDLAFTTNVQTLASTASTATSTLTAASFFRCSVTCAGSTTISTPVPVLISPISLCQCVTSHSQCAGDGIINVAIVGSTLNNASTGCPGSGNYTYFTPGISSATLSTGTSYTLATTVQTDPNQFTNAWIDYNGDGTLSASEALAITSINIGASGTSAIVFTVPFTATAGITRLRVRSGVDLIFTTAQACGANPASTYGEVEDYDITIAASPFLFSLVGQNILCKGINSGEISANIFSGVAPISYTINPAVGSQPFPDLFTNLPVGTYTIDGVDAASNTYSSVITITEPATALSASFTSVAPLCFGDSNGVLNIVGAGGTPWTSPTPYAYLYDWYDAMGNLVYADSNITTVPAGNYTVTAEDQNGCFVTVTNVTVAAPTLLVASATSTNVLCFGGNDGTATITASGGTGTIEYSKDNVTYQTSNILTGFSAGSFTVYAKDANGCTKTNTITITEPSSAVSVSASAGTILCNGGTTMITTTTSGGTGTITNDAPTMAVGFGTYVITATDANMCTTQTTVVITEPAAVTVSASAGTILCNGGTTMITTITSGGTGTVTNDGPTMAVGIGTYVITATDANMCTAQTTVVITQPAALVGSSIDTACVSYVFNAVTYTVSGVYPINLIASNGCDSLHTLNLTIFAYPTVLNDTICAGGMPNLTASASGTAVSLTGTFTGATSASSPTFNRTLIGAPPTALSGLGTAVPYQTFSFSVPTTGSYDFTNNSGFDNYALIYSGSFNPANALMNILAADDDAGPGSNSFLSINLTAGTNYVFVFTGFSNGDFGSFSVNITPNVNASSVVALEWFTQSTGGVSVASGNSFNPIGNTSVIAAGGAYANLVDANTAGTYSFWVSEIGSPCRTQVDLLINPNPTISATAGTILCNGGTADITLTTGGGTGAITTSPSNTGLVAGSFTFTATDANMCTATSTAILTEPTIVTISATAGTILCNGGTADITLTTGGGTGTITTSPSNTGLVAGSYTFTATDANMCSATATAILTEPTAVTISATAGTILCNGGTADITLTTGGGTGTITTSPSNLGLVAGSYTFTAMDANMCSASTSATISPAPSAISIAPLASQIACAGGSADISFTPVGGTGAITVTSNGVAATSPLLGLAAGNYTLVATDANMCTTSVVITIAPAPAPLTLSLSATTIACYGDNSVITATPSGGTPTYAYGTGGVSPVNTFTVNFGPLSATYTVLCTDFNGCTATETVVITQPTAVTVVATAGTILCNGGTADITLTTGGGTGAITTSPSNTGLIAGSYTFTAMDANMCPAIATAMLSEPTIVTISATAGTILCNGGTADITLTTGGGTGAITTSPSNTGLVAGSYTFTATDANMCTATATAMLTQPMPVTISATPGTILCNGGTADITLTTGGGTGTITTSPSNTGLVAGSYTFTATDANMCTASVTAMLTEPTAVTISATAGTILCNGGTANINLTTGGGTGTITTSPSNTGLIAGSYTFTATDANMCTATVVSVLGDPVLVTASATVVNNVSCFGGTNGSASAMGTAGAISAPGNIQIQVTGAGYFDETQYRIVDASNNIVFTYGPFSTSGVLGTSATFTATNPPYTLQVVAIGSNFLDNRATFNILCNSNIIGSGCYGALNASGACPNTGNLSIPIASCVSAGYTYSWSNGTSNATATGLVAGTYTVTVSNANGCSTTQTVTITEPSALTISATPGTILCNGGTADITLTTGGGTGTITTSPSNTGLIAGSYTFTATDANMCTATATAMLTQPMPVTISATPGTILCNGGTADITLTTGGGTGTITTSPSNTGLVAGSYTFTATDANMCTASVTAMLTEPTVVTISAVATQPLCSTDLGSVVLTSAGGTGTIVETGSTSGLGSGTFTFTATDANMCSASTTVTITVPAVLVAGVSASSISIPAGNTLTLTTTPSGMTTYAVAGPGGIANSGSSDVYSTVVNAINSGIYTVTVTNANGCTATSTVNVVVFPGSRLALKTMLNGPFNAIAGMMHDSLRVKGLIPTTEPYSAAPYTATYSHVNGGGGETIGSGVLAVTGPDAIVDWVFVQLRSKTNSSVVLATRSGLIQRDGDIVESSDGTSALLFANSIPDDYFVSVEHRNHLGVMTQATHLLNGVGYSLDLTTTAVPLFTFAGRAGNPTPLTGATKMVGAVRTLYAGNCNIALVAAAHRYITYNNTINSDRYTLLNATGGTSTIVGYNILDINMDGLARFNGLNPDRLIIFQNCANSNTAIVNEQTPN